jgi:ABC-2 type transport system permease protein
VPLSVYFAAYKTALQAKLEYRLDFAIGVLTSTMMQLAALSFLWIVTHQAPVLGGWRGTQILLLFGMTASALGLSELFLNHIWMVPSYIVSGDLDRLLVYPVRSLPFLLVTRPELHAFGNLAMGAAMVVTALVKLHVPPGAWALVPIWIASGVVGYTSALVVFCGYSFRFVGPSAYNLFMAHTLLQSTRYPLAIYPRWLRFGLLVVVPLGTFHYLPATWLLGKGGAWWCAGIGVAAAAAFAAVAARVWSWSLDHYQSTGS